jgi:outer membrane protein assembly factor BamB
MPRKRQRRRAALAAAAWREYTESMRKRSAPHADPRQAALFGTHKVVALKLFAILVGCYSLVAPLEAVAQFGIVSPGELTDTIRVNEPDTAVRTLLERIRVNLDERQWDEAIESLRQIMENHGERLMRFDDSRYVPLRDYCHYLLTKLPDEGLSLYRGRVDAQAKEWLDDGLRRRDRNRLQQVVDELFASSHVDEALFELGEIALEQGEYGAARGYWERVSPKFRGDAATPLWLKNQIATQPGGSSDGATNTQSWLVYPDSDLNAADVRARLVLVSIMEGAHKRADAEYQAFIDDYPNEAGRLAGREAPYRETLAALLSASKSWPSQRQPDTPTTFAGTLDRNFIAPGPFRLRRLAWSVPFVESWQANAQLAGWLPERRVAESAQNLLSYHPLVVGDLVVWHDLHRVYVYNLKTGEPAWPRTDSQGRPGEVARVSNTVDAQGHPTFSRTLGVPRFAPTIARACVSMRPGESPAESRAPCYLFVRLGSHITSRPTGSRPSTAGEIQVLDLAQQGKKVATLVPENENWSFEGAPVVDGPYVYLAMRYSDVRPQQHVACYELITRTDASGTAMVPALRWRTLVCAAESPARGTVDEITHNLLTFVEGTLYLNTNLGAVASLSAADGRLKWLTTYPRSKRMDQAANFFRDLNPCIYHRGTLYVAPTDSPHVMAFDAMTGKMRWASPSALADVVHLLGVAEGSLIASGRQLWWLDAETGRIVNSFPDNVNESLGHGRGMLVGDAVVWPSHKRLYVFRQMQELPDGTSKTGMVRDPIRLPDYNNALTGGNLVAAGDYVLLATADRLWAFGPEEKDIKDPETKNAR